MNDKEKINKRNVDCFNLEMRFNGYVFMGWKSYNVDFNIDGTELTCDSDEQWDEKIEKLTEELKRRKVRRGLKDIIIDVPERFIGKYKNKRISIVKTDNDSFDVDIRDETNFNVMEAVMYFNDMEESIEFSRGYINRNYWK